VNDTVPVEYRNCVKGVNHHLIPVEGYARQETGRQATDRMRIHIAGRPVHEISDKEKGDTGGKGRSSNHSGATSVTNRLAEKHRDQRSRIHVAEPGVATVYASSRQLASSNSSNPIMSGLPVKRPESDVNRVFTFLEQISGPFTEPFSSMVRGVFP